MNPPYLPDIFQISSNERFSEICLEIFRYQAHENKVYSEYLTHLNCSIDAINRVEEIPFIPIEMFKSRKIHCGILKGNETEFTSSGTSGSATSKHLVKDINCYRQSFLSAFELFYGKPEEYRILALLPSYLERTGSSLVFMVNELIQKSGNPESGFFLDDRNRLRDILASSSMRKTLLIGVSFALLEFLEKGTIQVENTVVMETGGMKGRRKEMTREELHEKLRNGFGVEHIHSEYGMTELLSQAYSAGEGIFRAPSWMKILIRDANDPFTYVSHGKTGGINIIDLANLHSCSFIASSDLGKKYHDDSFEVLGRFDYSDIRGCNLMVSMD